MCSIVISLIIIFSICILQAQNSSQKFEKVVFDSTTIEQINTNSYPCITCEIIQSIYKKHFEELKHYEDFKIRKPAVYTEEEQIVYNMLFKFMTTTMKEILLKLMDSSFKDRINVKEVWGKYNLDFYQDLISTMSTSLELNNKETPFNNYQIRFYFFNFLHELKKCPNHLVVSYGISLNDNIFTFENINELTYITLFTRNNEPMTKSDEYGPDYPQLVEYNVLSHYSLGKNFTTPCTRAYSIYKWDKSNLQSQRWIRMK